MDRQKIVCKDNYFSKITVMTKHWHNHVHVYAICSYLPLNIVKLSNTSKQGMMGGVVGGVCRTPIV